jgi:tetratricopeptide (TPR) repeat protein
VSSAGRIFLLYHLPDSRVEAEQLLDVLDHEYPDRVADFGVDSAAPSLGSAAASVLRPADIVLLLVDPAWTAGHRTGDPGGPPLPAWDFSPARTMCVAVNGAQLGDALSLSAGDRATGMTRLLEELARRLQDRETPSGVDGTFQEAAALQKQGKHREAITLFERVAASGDPEFVGPAAYGAARSYEQVRDPAHAVRAYERAIAAGPRDAAAVAAYTLGKLLSRRREFSEASDAFASAIRLGDDEMRETAIRLRDAARQKAGRR